MPKFKPVKIVVTPHTIEDETTCANGPTVIFPSVVQCPNKPTKYLFGDPYCDSCYKIYCDIHAKFNS